jgi:hypothetical protein
VVSLSLSPPILRSSSQIPFAPLAATTRLYICQGGRTSGIQIPSQSSSTHPTHRLRLSLSLVCSSRLPVADSSLRKRFLVVVPVPCSTPRSRRVHGAGRRRHRDGPGSGSGPRAVRRAERRRDGGRGQGCAGGDRVLHQEPRGGAPEDRGVQARAPALRASPRRW